MLSASSDGSGTEMAKEYRIEGFLLEETSFAHHGILLSLYHDQKRLCEIYAPKETKIYHAVSVVLTSAIEILHPRLPEDFFKDFSG